MDSPAKPRLLDQVRDKYRVKHYSIRTKKSYTDWIRRFILFHNKCHPNETEQDHVLPFTCGKILTVEYEIGVYH